ncbi:4-amino-4-deoxy-L-arabinose-phosphoundecaprenol flippase subunit ArnF [Entomohabitans teleogrylli]|uniref:4-amino-4-deoxy-L-arabinose-phosphoundecaprenol flippase subunit ArnF n=1 Tax=Entomohabitans teleogrylli TaxID=1384589 RepID=UPI00073D26F6|nr:4-amino-4-deoxy-L-arabinose-phosphoundecaprenol flippase subunit ArnF [Entomohabitans teleogrylli]
MGYFWALASVLLVSGAQLAMKAAMATLPAAAEWRALFHSLLTFAPGTLLLLAGLAGYMLSMGCWFMALHQIRLSKVYALLSLSYILVWAAAIWLPGWHEPFSWRSLAGIAAIIAGVLLIWLPSRRR